MLHSLKRHRRVVLAAALLVIAVLLFPSPLSMPTRPAPQSTLPAYGYYEPDGSRTLVTGATFVAVRARSPDGQWRYVGTVEGALWMRSEDVPSEARMGVAPLPVRVWDGLEKLN